ncbi:MAG: PLDc N-terminal domain-containing protein [Acidobacteriota bacterium]
MKQFLWLASMILSLAAIRDLFRTRRDWATRVVLLVIILVPFVGAGLYFFALRDRRPY